MVKFFNTLADKKFQYIIIIWVLFLKTIEITADMLSEIEFLRFFSILSFNYLSPTAHFVWNMLVIFTVIWLIYRLLKDIFKISIALYPLSTKELLNLALLLVWTVSVTITSLQFAVLVTSPLADPKLEVSRYYTPLYCENENSYLVEVVDVEGNKVNLDLSKSIFADPFSICKTGEILEGRTKYVGASYFTVKNSSLGQSMIEMRFCGNGSDGLQGWFANRVQLQDRLLLNENATLMLLLKLTPSSDGTAWTYIKIDFLSKENEMYSLTWKFQDIPANYVYSSNNGTRNNYILGSVTDWTFYQFDLNNLFYTSFSRYPHCITCIEYGVGAEADNDITAQFLVARISQQPLEINEMRVDNLKPDIKLKGNNSIIIRGLCITKLLVTLTPKFAEKNISTQWSILKISRTEFYKWNTTNLSNTTEINLNFNVTTNSIKYYLNGKEIVPHFQKQPVIYKLSPQEKEITLIVVNKTDIYLMPIVLVMSIIILIFLIVKKGFSRYHR